MPLINAHPKCKLMKCFAALGPYLRDSQCQKDYFFFDCLAICVDIKLPPEKRQFWGWWLELRPEDKCFIYTYQFGLYTQDEQWMVKKIKAADIQQKLETTFIDFYERLNEMLASIDCELRLESNINVSPNMTRLLVSQ